MTLDLEDRRIAPFIFVYLKMCFIEYAIFMCYACMHIFCIIIKNSSQEIQESLRDNRSLLHFDLRFTGVDHEAEFAIQALVDRNLSDHSQQTAASSTLAMSTLGSLSQAAQEPGCIGFSNGLGTTSPGLSGQELGQIQTPSCATTAISAIRDGTASSLRPGHSSHPTNGSAIYPVMERLIDQTQGDTARLLTKYSLPIAQAARQRLAKHLAQCETMPRVGC
ncbi:unnamed protein product [Protopolystoma xenopodis]|uniref:Uncharacterized protein n=1 Tax=Protopolystoma xenopodis TaxID=117903 RepID=A0A3S5AE74_9PLAT|nr:unnamed protein product [Protopolystoma xenopodis]